mgnify:CR=1 FL=1
MLYLWSQIDNVTFLMIDKLWLILGLILGLILLKNEELAAISKPRICLQVLGVNMEGKTCFQDLDVYVEAKTSLHVKGWT